MYMNDDATPLRGKLLCLSRQKLYLANATSVNKKLFVLLNDENEQVSNDL